MTQTQTCFASVMIALAPLLVTAIAEAAPADAAKGTIDSTDSNTRVRSLFRKAATASQAGKYDEARQLLLEAWSIRQTYDVASSLAQVEIQLKRYRDAAEHLEFCIRNFAPVESEQTLDQAKNAFAELKTRVAMVKISTDRQGAEVFVDSRGVGTDPLPAVLFVEPGPHRLAARLDGNTAEQSLNAQAGKEYIAELKLSDGETKTATPVMTPTSSKAESPLPPVFKANYTPAVVTASVGGVALISGVVLFLEASHKDSQWHERLDRLPGSNQCAAQNPNASECDGIRTLANDARTFRALSLVGFGTALAAGVATYLFWPVTPAKSRLGVRTLALPSRAGVDVFAGVYGSF